MLINIQHLNRTTGYRYGPDDDELEEMEAASIGELYRKMRAAYGRCTGHVCTDVRASDDPPGTFSRTLTIGWVFLKREQYENKDESFLQETWITVHKSKPTIRHNYAHIGK